MGCGASSKKIQLTDETKAQIEALYTAIKVHNEEGKDDGKGINRAEATKFFKGKFGKLSADAMFNEVDSDKSDDVSREEFLDFWTQVRRSGYKEDDMCQELAEMIEASKDPNSAPAWIDWKDDRDVGGKGK